MVVTLAKDAPGEEVFLSGNSAIARGAIEAGVQIATSYPGTPASEILESLASVAKIFGIHAEWSTNEMVAFETAAGAAAAGLRSIVSMKHVGMNWVMDPLMVINMTGVDGGLVLVSADDPGGHSSQNEQDNRFYGMFAEILTLEPSSVQEAKDMTLIAFELSERLKLPVIIRSVTRLSHSGGNVLLGEIQRKRRKPKFERKPERWIARSIYTVKHHRWLHQQKEKIKRLVENFPFNTLEVRDVGSLGIIASGVSYSYAKEAVRLLNLKNVGFLKIGSYPFPEGLVRKMLNAVDKVLIVEEVEPFVEQQVQATKCRVKKDVQIRGKLTGDIPMEGELSTDIIAKALAKITGNEVKTRVTQVDGIIEKAKAITPPRPLAMCPGCPHRGGLFALRGAIRKLAKEETIVTGDIGCYGMGASTSPFGVSDTQLCMGASIGLGNGFAQAGIRHVIATIGDSTFIHAGIPALINAVYNNAKIKVLIFDNMITAMTGSQPHPAVGVLATGEKTTKISIEEIVKACGVRFVEVVDPYNLKATRDAIEKAIKFDGVAVVILRRLCSLERDREYRKKKIKPKPYAVDVEKCTGCKVCITQFGCPAIVWREEDKKAAIDLTLCDACGVCEQVCPLNAILA